MKALGSGIPKHEQVYRALRDDIASGRRRHGERLPSEADLVQQFGVSRITIGRAMRDLQLEGLVDRRRGAGTFVSTPAPSTGLSFGLLIPDLGTTEIFETICQGMVASPMAQDHALVWGSQNGGGESKETRAWHLCRQYVDRMLTGVFFAPLELTPGKDAVNLRISQALQEAGIPVVLLDRTVTPYPERGPHDLVGIDNRRAGYVMTEHLIRAGAECLAFVAAADSAATVDAREEGFREALFRAGRIPDLERIQRLDVTAREEVERLMNVAAPDAIVCANDHTAARLMRSLLALGHDIPGSVRLVGIDDLGYAGLLPIPLTTYRQPARQIGAAAMVTMIERLQHDTLPIRDVLLEGELVVRESCGASTPR